MVKCFILTRPLAARAALCSNGSPSSAQHDAPRKAIRFATNRSSALFSRWNATGGDGGMLGRKGFKNEQWDLFCLDPAASSVPASQSLHREIAVAEKLSA